MTKKKTQKKNTREPRKQFFLHREMDLSFFGKVSLTEQVLFAKHLAVMLRSGLTISEALFVATDSAEKRLKRILRKVTLSVQSGNSLAEALAKHPKDFSDMFVSIVSAGEQGGSLEQNLLHLSLQLDKERKIHAKIKGAMVYPMVVLIAAFILGMGMAFFVLPQIVPMFTGLRIELPFTTRGLIWFASLMETHGVVISLLIFLGAIGLSWLLKRKFSRPFTHAVLLRLPIMKPIVRGSNLMRFSLVLGTLLKSGLTVDEALMITERTVSNYYYQRAFKDILKHVQKGGKISQRLEKHKNLFPPMVVNLVRVGEESGKLDETLLYISEFYETEVDESTKSLTTALEPLLLLVIGIVVAFLALSIITPIYEVTGSIQ
ncbi:MAG: type II secretion system F family protein [Candidatus Magasanikbacteria bacterium]